MFSQAEYDALVDGAGWLERTDRGRLHLSGADRRTYLQGLLTNDIAALAPGDGCYAAMLTPQGRMVADMRVLELGDRILIDLERSLTAAIGERFDQFIFSEDVSVSDESVALAQIGLYGPRCAAVLAGALARLDSGSGAGEDDLRRLRPFRNVQLRAGTAPLIVAASDDFGVEGFELFLEPSGVEALRGAVAAAGAVPVHMETAEVCRIESGRPRFLQDMDEQTIPLEAGIEGRAISQTKGCYVGQEIIIRVLHRGHGRVARRLVGLLVDGPPPAHGDRLRSGDREVGFVTSGAHSPALGRAVALGYVHRDYVEPGTLLTIAAVGGETAASVASLPFVSRHASRGSASDRRGSASLDRIV
jgi:folate-binding protein YgfZ